MKNNNTNKNLQVQLSHKRVESNGRLFDNLIITTPKGTTFEIKLSFYNRKLLYKILCEIEGVSNAK